MLPIQSIINTMEKLSDSILILISKLGIPEQAFLTAFPNGGTFSTFSKTTHSLKHIKVD